MADGTAMTIGELADAVGVPTSTVRYWERQGLSSPTKWESGQRRYDRAALPELRLLRLCQEVGFSIAEICALRERRHVDPVGWRRLLRDKVVDLQRQQSQLEHARSLLEHALTCDSEYIVDCPSFQDWFSRWEPQTTRRRSEPPEGPAAGLHRMRDSYTEGGQGPGPG